jgi:hypothetical protein
MKKLRILPGAAGIIALTATIGFVDGQRESETESFSQNRITLVSAQSHKPNDGASPGNWQETHPDRSAYLVEIQRGNKLSRVLIDAVTGKILLS